MDVWKYMYRYEWVINLAPPTVWTVFWNIDECGGLYVQWVFNEWEYIFLMINVNQIMDAESSNVTQVFTNNEALRLWDFIKRRFENNKNQDPSLKVVQSGRNDVWV